MSNELLDNPFQISNNKHETASRPYFEVLSIPFWPKTKQTELMAPPAREQNRLCIPGDLRKWLLGGGRGNGKEVIANVRRLGAWRPPPPCFHGESNMIREGHDMRTMIIVPGFWKLVSYEFSELMT